MIVTPGKGTFSVVVGPSVSTPSFSDLKSVNRSLELTWSKSGVRALYIVAWVAAFGPGSWYWPEGRMFRAMIVGSLAKALEPATKTNTPTTARAITTRRIPLCLLSRSRSFPLNVGGTLTNGPKGDQGRRTCTLSMSTEQPLGAGQGIEELWYRPARR